MLAPDALLRDHYRITYVVDQRSDCVLYRAIDQRDSLRVLIAALPQPNEAALSDVRTLAAQIATVEHAGLLRLRDHFGDELTYYLISDDVGGQDLERVARERGGPLPEDEVLASIDRLLSVFDVLHDRSSPLLLGDLRSTDLWSSPDGGLFLAPFVLARHVGDEPSPYRAPELADHQAEPNTSSDIYALGAVAYQLLTGWPPPISQQRQANTPLASPRTLNAKVSVLAEQLVLRALEMKPANRYQRAREMRSALETVRLMAGRPLGAGTPVIGETLRTVAPVQGAPDPVLPAGAPPENPAATQPPPLVMPPAPPPQYPGAVTVPPYAPAAPAAPAASTSPRISTGCLIAVVAALAVIALVVCLLGAFGVYLYLAPAGGLPSFGPAAAATAPAPLVDTAPAATAPAATAPAAGSDAPALGVGATFTQTQQLTEAAVGAVAYSPDGAQLAVALGNNVQLRNGEALEPGMTYEGHTGEVSAIVFRPDGGMFATGAQNDAVIRLWDPLEGGSLGTLEGHEGWIRSLAFSPDGRLLASGSTDQTVRLWEVSTGRQVAELRGHSDFLGAVAFSPDGTRLASAGRDGTVRLWDVSSGTARSEFLYTAPLDPASSAPYWLTGVTFSPDGAQLAVGSVSGSIFLLDAASGQVQRELRGHEGWVVIRGLSYSSDGRILASASLDGSVRLWGPGSGVELAVLEQFGLRLLGLSWHPNNQQIAVSSDTGGSVVVWDVEQRTVRQSLQLTQGAVTALAYTDSGAVLGTGGAGGQVRLHLLSDGREITLGGGAITSQYLDFLSETDLVAVSQDGDVVVIDLTAQGRAEQLQGLNGFALNLIVSPDRRLIAAGNNQGEITLWDGQTRERLRVLSGLSGSVYGLAFNNDGSELAAISNQNSPTLIVWDTASGDQKTSIRDLANPLSGVAMPAGADLVAGADSSGLLRIWNAADGSEVSRISADTADGWFSSFAFSPDGSILVTGALSGAVEFWDARSGQRLDRLELRAGTVLSLAFRGDGNQVAVSTRDGGVLLLEPGA